MGASTSKPETKVFTPAAPVDFSASFLAQLENSTESDYSRSQYTEKYIQERVAAELKKLERETVSKFQGTLKESLDTDGKNAELDVKNTNAKIEKLTKILEANAQFFKVEVDANVAAARSNVISCLKENKGKSLNCWEEVDEFKKLVKQV
ncbi:MICOS complex subunit Mic19p [[Candida] anglica]|uniref:MICOS complex subunit Mic19p n=1 Tax=[Candida] anglica TaxID=148631 RepID=A0ABP0EJ17_9ASCO